MAAENVDVLIRQAVEGAEDVRRAAERIRALGGDADQTQGEAERLTEQLDRLGNQRRLITQFGNVKRQIGETGDELDAARTRAAELGKQYNATEKPTAKLTREFERARNEVRELADRHQQQRRTLQDLRGELNSAGIATNDLAGAEQRIARESAEASGKLDTLRDSLQGTEKELEDTQRETDALRRDFEKIGVQPFNDVEQEINETRAAMERLRSSGKLSGRELRQAAKGANSRIAELRGTTRRSIGPVEGLRGAVAGLAGTLALLTGGAVAVSRVAEKLENVSRQAASLGTTAEQVQEINFAFREFGLQSDDVSDALNTLADRAQDAKDGTKSFIDDFKLIGIEVEDLRGKDPAQLFDLFVDRISKIEDPTRRNAAAVRILGDDIGNRLLPLLVRGAEGFGQLRQEARDAGAVLGKDLIEDAAEANRAFRNLKNFIGTQFTRLVAENADRIKQFVSDLRDAAGVIKNELGDETSATAKRVAGAFQTLVGAGKFLAGSLRVVFNTIQTGAAAMLAEITDKVAGAADALSQLTFGGLSDRLEREAAAIRATSEDLRATARQNRDEIVEASRQAREGLAEMGAGLANLGSEGKASREGSEEAAAGIRTIGEELDALESQADAAADETKRIGDEAQDAADRAVPSLDKINEAFEALGFTSTAALRKQADEARAAYDVVVAAAKAGEASQRDVNEAYRIAAERQLEAAAAAEESTRREVASNLRRLASSKEQRAALDDLIARYTELGDESEDATQRAAAGHRRAAGAAREQGQAARAAAANASGATLGGATTIASREGPDAGQQSVSPIDQELIGGKIDVLTDRQQRLLDSEQQSRLLALFDQRFDDLIAQARSDSTFQGTAGARKFADRQNAIFDEVRRRADALLSGQRGAAQSLSRDLGIGTASPEVTSARRSVDVNLSVGGARFRLEGEQSEVDRLLATLESAQGISAQGA